MTLKEYFKKRLISELSEDMAFDTAGAKESNRRAQRAQRAALALSDSEWSNPNDPVRQRYDAELARHVAQGGSDTVYTHDPATNTFKAITTLPAGLSDALASDAMRWSSGQGLSKREAETAVYFANRLGGLHGTASWEDPAISPLDMNYSVLPGTSTGKVKGKRRVTKANAAAIDWNRS